MNPRSTLTQLLLALGALWLLAAPATAEAPKGYNFVSYDEGLRLAAEQDRPVFLYFGRYGCGWCDKTNRESFSDPDLKALYEENYVLVYVDAESGRRMTLPSGERITELELGARMNVFATPVFGFLESDGNTIFTVPGYKTADEFRDFHRFVSGGHYREQRLFEFLAEQAR
ncbi:thioredoxin-related protein [Thioalkalivibrio sulfidiphilus HL-EbGr7]|uniref:Thioredoxin-related protein n=1 Tax=Thioalkalivibrio sulfidiphilus (strain HL-EbGR7) TaxID=396588 RepID=B8GUW4_THISH|nr:thioredoxin fold domain-containing protein [Thioalkalivibrio sulfidiphilus]ACL71475.1 thioredoxin-related protein [Thioalkalivibrio sulfidiphilus HL-EbGr7]